MVIEKKIGFSENELQKGLGRYYHNKNLKRNNYKLIK